MKRLRKLLAILLFSIMFFNLMPLQYKVSAEVVGVTVNTYEELQSVMVDNFKVGNTSFGATYTGDTADLSNKITGALNNALATDSYYYNIVSISYSISGVKGSTNIKFEIQYRTTNAESGEDNEAEPMENSVNTLEELKEALLKQFGSKASAFTITYTGEYTNITDEISSTVNSALKIDPQGYGITSISYSVSGGTGAIKIDFTIKYNTDIPSQDGGVQTYSMEQFKSALVEKLRLRAESFQITYCGDSADIKGFVSNTLNAALSTDSENYRVKATNYSISGQTTKHIISFSIEYDESSTNDEAFVVDGIEQLKIALIDNFSIKGTNLKVGYKGELADFKNSISNCVNDAILDIDSIVLVSNFSYSISSVQDNHEIMFAFTYDDSNDYDGIVTSIEELEQNLALNLQNRENDIDFVYKGNISGADAKLVLDRIMNLNPYLKYSVRNYRYETGSYTGVKVIKFDFEYSTSKKEEESLDKTINFIVSHITNNAMSESEKEKVIHDYILSVLTYNEDYSYANAYKALTSGQANCQGYAMLTYKMLKAAGIENTIVASVDHAWNVVKIDNVWYHLDSTWNDAPQQDMGFYKYYNLSDNEIKQTHDWGENEEIKCTSNYINVLENNVNGSRSNVNILEDIKKNTDYVAINNFKSNSFANVIYYDVVLKEGQQISLLGNNIESEEYTNLFYYESSDLDVVEFVDGIVKAKNAGTSIVCIKPKNKIIGAPILCTVKVLPTVDQDGRMPQSLSDEELVEFNSQAIRPNIIINSKEIVDDITSATDCYEELKGNLKMVGHPIDVKTTASFNWAEVSFKLDSSTLEKTNIEDLVICWYDDKTGTLVPQATVIDKVNSIVSTTVTHFSKYALIPRDFIYTKTINVSFVIDSIYSSQKGIDGLKENIKDTLKNLSRNSNVVMTFFDDSDVENANNAKRILVEQTDETYYDSDEDISRKVDEIWNGINAQGVVVDENNKDEASEIVTNALRKGREMLHNYETFSHIYARDYKNYVLVYTENYAHFVATNTIIELMGNDIGLILCNNGFYYKGNFISFNSNSYVYQPYTGDSSSYINLRNIYSRPLVEFLLSGDVSSITTNPNEIIICEKKNVDVKWEGVPDDEYNILTRYNPSSLITYVHARKSGSEYIISSNLARTEVQAALNSTNYEWNNRAKLCKDLVDKNLSGFIKESDAYYARIAVYMDIWNIAVNEIEISSDIRMLRVPLNDCIPSYGFVGGESECSEYINYVKEIWDEPLQDVKKAKFEGFNNTIMNKLQISSFDSVPPFIFDNVVIKKDGYELEFEWKEKIVNGEKRYFLQPMDFEEYYRFHTIHMTPGEMVSMVIGFTPYDIYKDVVDFTFGKDVITGDEIDRRILFAMIVAPEVIDSLIKTGIKNADEFVRIVKVAGEKAVEVTARIKNYLRTKIESVFEYVKETVDQGDSITCRTVDNLEVDIPKSELTSGEIKCLTDGCFTGDTLVRTNQGLKRIDSIQEGELVLSKNTKTGEIGYKPVLYVYRKSTTNFINLIVEDELIETTPTHLFMLESGNWRAAENLKSGDRILTADDEIKTVDEIQVVNYDKARPIFNLNVDEYHTYFITGLALLVHNDCNEITTDFINGNSTDYLEQLKIKSQVVINHEVGAAFENYVEGTKLAHVDYDIQELYGILDKSTGDIVQVKPDFTLKSLTTGEKVAFADAKTALTGRIPHDDQFERLVWLTEQETITGTLIYYVPSTGNYISDDMIRYANHHGVRILQVVAE